MVLLPRLHELTYGWGCRMLGLHPNVGLAYVINSFHNISLPSTYGHIPIKAWYFRVKWDSDMNSCNTGVCIMKLTDCFSFHVTFQRSKFATFLCTARSSSEALAASPDPVRFGTAKLTFAARDNCKFYPLKCLSFPNVNMETILFLFIGGD